MPSSLYRRSRAKGALVHVYSRGVSKTTIFKTTKDKNIFLHLLKRHLTKTPYEYSNGQSVKKYYDDVELVTFCIMDNHFHLVLRQKQEQGITKLLHSILTSYAIYYNKNKNHTGHVFESRYKSKMINNEHYKHSINGYIHKNPGLKTYKMYVWSSYQHYTKCKNCDWVRPND